MSNRRPRLSRPSPSPQPEHTSASNATVDESVASVIERLRATGGRATTARRLLLRSLFASTRHRTAEDLIAEIQLEAPDVHLSTVYRNLEELERLGVVAHVHLRHGPATYHLAPTTHCHLVCEECGAVLEVGDGLFASLAAETLREYGFTIDPHHFAMQGRCRDCSRHPPSE
ncbi:MAG TPA: Fur family transcriptional regulator [Acidimicrobiales bacterium]|nr:Fur family transcriptional regulator [Acidimicrobiales bacterium]